MRKGVQKIYAEVAGRYDLINRLMTFGLDVRWRKRAASAATSFGPRRILDVCCGTGDMALEISRTVPQGVFIVGTDFSRPMLGLAALKPFASPVSLVQSDALRLPFISGSFDCLSIAFATRNLDHGRDALSAYLAEFHRVLAPGGVLVHLETSQPPSRGLRSLFHAYVRHIVKPMGIALSGSPAGYRYLAHTIPRFRGSPELTRTLEQAGFKPVSHFPFLFHAAALHIARKPGLSPEEGSDFTFT